VAPGALSVNLYTINWDELTDDVEAAYLNARFPLRVSKDPTGKC
jgi:hypothetical protein